MHTDGCELKKIQLPIAISVSFAFMLYFCRAVFYGWLLTYPLYYEDGEVVFSEMNLIMTIVLTITVLLICGYILILLYKWKEKLIHKINFLVSFIIFLMLFGSILITLINGIEFEQFIFLLTDFFDYTFSIIIIPITLIISSWISMANCKSLERCLDANEK